MQEMRGLAELRGQLGKCIALFAGIISHPPKRGGIGCALGPFLHDVGGKIEAGGYGVHALIVQIIHCKMCPLFSYPAAESTAEVGGGSCTSWGGGAARARLR